MDYYVETLTVFSLVLQPPSSLSTSCRESWIPRWESREVTSSTGLVGEQVEVANVME